MKESLYLKKLLLIPLLFFFVAVLFSQTQINTVQSNIITVVMDNNYPPFVMQNPDGSLKGILVDQWNMWQETTGFRVQLIGMDWAKAQEFMQAGKADIIDTIFRTPEREKLYNFTKPYQRIDVPIYVHKSLSAVLSYDDLKGFKIAVKQGDACIGQLRTLGLTNIVEYPSYESIILAAREGIEFVFCVDQPPAQYFMIKYNLFKDYRILSILYTGFFHRAVAKSNPELLKLIEEGFSRIPASTFTYINEKWYGKSNYPVLSPTLVVILVSAGACVFIIIVVLIITAAVMRKRIQEQTANLNKILVALQQEKAFSDAVFTALPDIFYIVDTKGTILDIKQKDKPYTNYLTDKMNFLQMLDSEEEKTQFLHFLADAAQKLDVQIQNTKRIINGLMHYFELRIAPSSNNLFIVVVRDITPEIQIKKALETSLKEKEALLKEIHHRVKNNLQIVASILSLQIDHMQNDTDKLLLEENKNRIISIAQIHEHLYASENLSSINMAEYITSLVDEYHSYTYLFNKNIAYELALEPITFPIDKAIAVGLIINELITNAVKYAFPDTNGKITITLGYDTDKRITLLVEDNGKGLPPGFNPEHIKTLGYTLIVSLCKQHCAQLTLAPASSQHPNPGLKVSISFLQ
ncbi:MAG TPA: transporter substrate-binding domain-containing protein [Spirochaetia bacterium]|nr:transporter substrate-binding domain-containing protein [Spirochaetales bacterium]HQK34168.1 transporter substrate-binding domain-containing protein [Spirochaetales bacterium]HRS66291.1 transporter substrate-binding domain-containing protein [Spirochaetia bacterium]HRV27645.1 transporter substrate-binding domain-containing protein [Spirochaetia bacterium]